MQTIGAPLEPEPGRLCIKTHEEQTRLDSNVRRRGPDGRPLGQRQDGAAHPGASHRPPRRRGRRPGAPPRPAGRRRGAPDGVPSRMRHSHTAALLVAAGENIDRLGSEASFAQRIPGSGCQPNRVSSTLPLTSELCSESPVVDQRVVSALRSHTHAAAPTQWAAAHAR